MKKVALAFTFFYGFIAIIGQQIKIDGKVTMLALGDSYTIGESVDMSERWPHQFIDQLRSFGLVAAYPDYIAITGWTTRRLIQGINSMLDDTKSYNLVSILIGVNNQYQRIDIASYEPDLKEIIDRALEITDQDTSGVFMLSIPDYAYTPYGRGNTLISKEIDDYNNINKRVAEEYHIAYIDITPISRFGLNNPSLVAGDGLHPSGRQYGEWVEAIIPHLSLSQTPSGTNRQFFPEYPFKVYPNPAGKILYIESSLDINQIRIFDAMGSIVSDQKLYGLPARIDLSHLAPGTYTLRVSRTNGIEPLIYKTIIILPG